MHCPKCNKKVAFLETLKITRWSNHRCKDCSAESTRTALNAVIVYLAANGAAFIAYWFALMLGAPLSMSIILVFLFAALYPAEAIFGRLVLVEDT